MFARLLILIGVLTLSACATQNYTPTGRFVTGEIKPGDGVVVVKVMNVKPVSLLNKKWSSLNVQNKTTGVVESIRDTASSAANYSLFVGTLPPGNYEISNFDAAGLAPGTFGVLPMMIMFAMTSDSQGLASQPATFTVKPDTVSNLGIMVTSQPNDTNDQFEIAILADENARTAAFDDVETSTKQRIGGFPVASWDHMPGPDSLAKAADIIRRNALLTSMLGTTKDGKLLIGGPLGMTYVRTGVGAWDVIQTGTMDWVVSINALDDGRYWAGTDNGRLFVCSIEQRRCQQTAGTSPDAIVARVVPMNEWGYAVFSVNSTGRGAETHVVVMKDILGVDAGKEVLKVDGNATQAVLFDGRNLRIYQLEPGISRTSNVYQYIPASGETSQSYVDFWVHYLYPTTDGTLVMNRMNGMSRYNDISPDNGQSWIRNDVSAPISSRMHDAKIGYGIENVSIGWNTSTISLVKTSDGGKNWARTGSTMEAFGTVPITLSDGRIFMGSGKALVSTADEGTTWNIEWPVAH